jgi:hypothetical protein
LGRKARDVKQACPFGYWEAVDRRAAWESVKPGAVVAGLSDMLVSRRAVLGGTVAAGASLLLTQKVRAAEGGKCYIPITPCDQGDATHVHCSKVEGMAQGDSFRNKADESCYKIASVKPVEKYGVLATGVSGESDGCEDCGPGDAPDWAGNPNAAFAMRTIGVTAVGVQTDGNDQITTSGSFLDWIYFNAIPGSSTLFYVGEGSVLSIEKRQTGFTYTDTKLLFSVSGGRPLLVAEPTTEMGYAYISLSDWEGWPSSGQNKLYNNRNTEALYFGGDGGIGWTGGTIELVSK